MSLEFFKLTGYIAFIAPAFIFTFVSCLALFLSTNKEFKKYEKIFLKEIKKIDIKEIKLTKENKDASKIFVY